MSPLALSFHCAFLWPKGRGTASLLFLSFILCCPNTQRGNSDVTSCSPFSLHYKCRAVTSHCAAPWHRGWAVTSHCAALWHKSRAISSHCAALWHKGRAVPSHCAALCHKHRPITSYYAALCHKGRAGASHCAALWHNSRAVASPCAALWHRGRAVTSHCDTLWYKGWAMTFHCAALWHKGGALTSLYGTKVEQQFLICLCCLRAQSNDLPTLLACGTKVGQWLHLCLAVVIIVYLQSTDQQVYLCWLFYQYHFAHICT